MTIAVYLPLVMSVLLAATARLLSHRLTPRAGGWAMAVAGCVVALSSVWALGLLTISLVDELPEWPLPVRDLPVPDGVSLAAGTALAWSVARVAMALWRHGRHRRRLHAIVAGAKSELVVVGGVRPQAFAVAGRPGWIVVTTPMLRALTAPQRRAMLAHERAHLRARHSTTLIMAQLAAAVNPLLVPVCAAVSFLCERHADDVAAAEVGDRVVVAEALAVAALAESAPKLATPLLAFHKLGVVGRVTALTGPRPRYTRTGLVTAATVAAIAVAAALDATDQFCELVRGALPI